MASHGENKTNAHDFVEKSGVKDDDDGEDEPLHAKVIQTLRWL